MGEVLMPSLPSIISVYYYTGTSPMVREFALDSLSNGLEPPLIHN